MFLANVIFWGQDKGGRFTHPQSGFKPHIKVGDVYTSCIVTSTNDTVTVFEFDELSSVKLELMYPKEYGNRLSVGSKVSLFEGNKQIAEGEIVGINGVTH